MLVETCILINIKKKLPEKQLLRKKGTKNMSVDVINCALSLKVWLGETLPSFKKNNMMMSGVNMEKLLMLLKFQMVMMQCFTLSSRDILWLMP